MDRPAPTATQRAAEYPRANHYLLHISDTHLLAEDKLYDSVDSTNKLEQLMDSLVMSKTAPEAIIFTGDLADHGETDAYRKLKAIVEPAAASMGSRIIWVMGNHDDRANFRQTLLSQPRSQESVDRVTYIGGLRIITLDTTVPGHHYGEIDPSQLDWLRRELATPAPEGTILAMHHPPIPCIQDMAVTVELRDQRNLAQVLRGTDVRAIIAGHLHYSTSATFAGIPVSVAAATCYNQDLNLDYDSQRSWDGAQGFNLMHVYDETIVHSSTQIADFRELSYTTPEQTAQNLQKAGVHIPGRGVPASEMLSSQLV